MSYSPTLGRFLEKDPEGYTDGMNLYQGYRSNPLAFVDPMGTDSIATTQPTTQPHDPTNCLACGGRNDIADDRKMNEDNWWLSNWLGFTAPICDHWANPGYGTIVNGIFNEGVGIGVFNQNDMADDSSGKWTQAGANAIKQALGKWLSRPLPGDKDPRGFILDDPKAECPCGYFKSSFFIRTKSSTYHFHHYSRCKGKWTEKEGPRNPAADVKGDPMQDSGGGYLVAVYCLKGKERHTPGEL